MYTKLKEEIKNIIEIVQQCPEKFQEKCFDMLLNQYLSDINKNNENSKPIAVKTNTEEETISESAVGEGIACESSTNDEIKISDFHIKIQKFLSNNAISITDINNLYYKDNNRLLPLYETLGSTKMSECQMRITLLTAFENSFSDNNGEMYFNGEIVRSRCQELKCYDGANFSTILKKNSVFFDNFGDKYDKNVNYNLSVEGKKELAKVIMELVKEL